MTSGHQKVHNIFIINFISFIIILSNFTSLMTSHPTITGNTKPARPIMKRSYEPSLSPAAAKILKMEEQKAVLPAGKVHVAAMITVPIIVMQCQNEYLLG